MLVIHQGALGDFILTLPALVTLRKAFPHAKSVIMGYLGILELVEQRFYAEQILSIDQRGMASFFVKQGVLDQSLYQFFSTFNLVVVFGKDREEILTQNLKRVCQGKIIHMNPFPSLGERIHVTDHLLKQCGQNGIPVTEGIPRLHLTPSDRDWGEDFWIRKGLTEKERTGVVLLHPGSGSKRKVWPLKQFSGLAHYFQHDLKSRVLVILGPAEGLEVQKAFEDIRPPAPIWVRGLSLRQLASVMEGCRLFIGNDSGLSHMAAALGLPTIAIFGPTDPNVWGPRGKKVLVIRKDIPCSPCSQETFFQCKDFECLNGIGLEEVLRGLERMGMEGYI